MHIPVILLGVYPAAQFMQISGFMFEQLAQPGSH